MDDIKTPRPRRIATLLPERRSFLRPVHAHPALAAAVSAHPKRKGITLHIKVRKPSLPRLPISDKTRHRFRFLRNVHVRIAMGAVAGLVIVAEIITLVQPYLTPHVYAMGASESLLSPISQPIADKLHLDTKQKAYVFTGYKPSDSANILGVAGQQISATAYQDASKGVVVTDPTNHIDFTLTPQYELWAGKQDGNRVVYPLRSGQGWLVYTMHGIGVKEDLLLKSAADDKLVLTYKMGLGQGLSARIEQDGSIGVYGNTLLSGTVATATENDAKLLDKARQNAPKNTLLFKIPAPVIKQRNRKPSAVKAVYTLDGGTLTLTVSNLQKGQYPLSIDPSIYVETAQKFMRGNNDTNIDFDVADTLIQKGMTTGARFNSWTNSMSMPVAVWGQGTAVAGGYVYSAGGQSANGKIFTTAGTSSYVVPAGVTSITVKAWGAGGGGGAGSASTGVGGGGGGGGYTTATITVTPGETLNVDVGTAGTVAPSNSKGGNGGGYSALRRSATFLLQAGGGGGGGGTSSTSNGGAGGAGGGASGVAGSNGAGTGFASGGGQGTNAAGGGGGAAGTSGVVGSSGAANLGGDAGGSGTTCSTSIAGNRGGAGGTGAGGKGGTAGTCSGGGGGGGGRFGGGGGGSTATGAARGAGGGGGGSDLVTGTGTTETAGSGTTPGNSGDSVRNGAGQGGTGGVSAAASTSGSNGLVFITYGSGATVTGSVAWAKFSTSNGTIGSPDPGTGTCTGWCTDSAYDLPDGRMNFSLVAYNGFLYAIGGESSNCTTGNGTGDSGVCKTVYIAKLGANGEPQLWSPTSTDQTTWTYWNRDGDLSSPRSLAGAVAYNNRMYLLGGKTSASGVKSVVSTVEEADITGTGTLTSWTTSGMVTLRDPTNNASTLARYGFGAQVYNDHIYVIGGATSLTTGSPLANSQYITLNSDGTMYGNWITTTSFSTGRMTNGGNFTTVWGAYIYLSGGCTAYNASGYCTAVATDTQLASINTDGSLDIWNTNASVSDQRMGYGLVAWRNVVYEFGGCTGQNTTDGSCTVSGIDNSLNTATYGTINQDGDASTVGSTVTSGTAPCSGGAPYGCNLPSASVGNVLNEAAIMNGYLYIMGGCTNNACTTVSTGVTYQAIGSDGSLQKPATCTGSYTDSYCVSSSSLPTGLAAAATTVFNGRIYLVGGFTTGTNIYYVSVNTDGSLGAWSAPVALSGITTPATTTLTYSYAYARANPASAGSVPGNLYILGGCTDGTVGCSNYTDTVFKCNISTTGAPSACNTSGQLQIGAMPGGCGTGLGAAAGAVYANYIYLIGGLTPNCTDLKTARYAKFDNNNNIVTVGSGWVEGGNQTATGRRRGAGFGYNGYLYVVGGYDGGGGGVLADIEFAKINVSDGSWGPFTVSSVTINQRWGLTVPISNSFAYVVGGCTAGAAPSSCTTRTNTTQTFQIYNNDSGTPAGYSVSAATYGTNPNRIGASATVLNGYLYVAGGCTSTGDCTNAVNTVSYATIDANGVIGSWSNTTANLPAVRAWGRLEAAGGTLYYIGGQDSTATNEQSTVYYGTPSSGDVTTWSTATQGLPAARSQFGAAVWNNRLYVVGGLNGSSSPTATVYVSPQLNSGGNITSAWGTTSTSFNVARYGLTAVAYANNLYVFGGNDGSNYLGDSQYVQISTSDGSVGSWTYTTGMPTPLMYADGFAINGYVYLIGGRSASAVCRPITLVSPISANTTIASGNNPTGVGEWFETNQRYIGDRYGVAAVYSNGKAYVIGGACQSATAPVVSSVTSTNTGTGFASDATTHAVSMPATVAAGDLLLMLYSYDDNTATVTDPDGAGGWTQIAVGNSGSGGVTGSVWAKVATGTEGGTTVGFTTSTSQSASAQVYRVLAANWSGDITNNGIDVATGTGATTANPDPPALNPAKWDTENALWIAYSAGSTFTAVTTYPTNYVNGAIVAGNSGAAGASTSSATRALSASSEDPGTFTMSASNSGIPFTIAVRPPLTYNGSNEIQQTALLTQPQVAKYSIMFDTDSDVYPTKWLLNGVDNSTGANWQFNYRSMSITNRCTTSAMSTWGVTTNFGNVTLGTPGVYNALDGSGANMNCARFYYLAVKVDSSQAYGYPDDVTRGPTITDLTLELTADPGKRLMHGRTFTGGLQQPDDTPF
jgi:hypothetical protein